MLSRIRPYINPSLCLAVNPLRDDIRIGIYPLYKSDRSLWRIYPIDNNVVQIVNNFHPEYLIKVGKYSPRLGLYLPHDEDDKFNLTGTEYGVYTIQISTVRYNFLSYDKKIGLSFGNYDNIESKLWIFDGQIVNPLTFL